MKRTVKLAPTIACVVGCAAGGALVIASDLPTPAWAAGCAPSAASAGFPIQPRCVPPPDPPPPPTPSAPNPVQNDAPPVKAADNAILRQSIGSITFTIQNHLTNFLFSAGLMGHTGGSSKGSSDAKGSADASSNRRTGLSAGEPTPEAAAQSGFSTWVDGSLALLDNGNTGKRYHGNHKVGTFGADYKFTDQLLLGVALAPDETSLELRSLNGHRAAAGGTGSLYAGYKLDDTYAVAAMLGYGHAYNFIKLPSGAAWTKSNYESDRYFGQVNVSAAYLLDEGLRLLPSLSYTQSAEVPNSSAAVGTMSGLSGATRLGTARAAAQLEYAVTDYFVPFVSAAVEHDVYNAAGSAGRTGFALGGGFQSPVSDSLTLGLSGTSGFGRGGQTEQQFSLNLRYNW